jgi:hypothetical protein
MGVRLFEREGGPEVSRILCKRGFAFIGRF